MKIECLKIEDAVELAALQNFERDVRMDLEDDGDVPSVYIEEVKHLLQTTGENYYPDYPDHAHIVWCGWKHV